MLSTIFVAALFLQQSSIHILPSNARIESQEHLRQLCLAKYSNDRCRQEFLPVFDYDDTVSDVYYNESNYASFRTSISECEAYGSPQICRDLLRAAYDANFGRLQTFEVTVQNEREADRYRMANLDDDEVISSDPIEVLAACSYWNTANGASAIAARRVPFPFNQNFEDHIFTHVGKLNRMMDLPPTEIPSVFFYDDSDGYNAIALSYKLSGDARYDQDITLVGGGPRTVLLGVNLIRDYTFAIGPNGRDRNTAALQSVIAHEFGHTAQYYRNIRRPTKQMELMADFMSGYYVGRLNVIADHPQTLENLRLAMKHSYDSGDFQYHAPNHHGTPTERANAFARGAQLATDGEDDYWDAFNRATSLY